MANSPIQVVLNSNDFISTWDREGGGPHKDFYANRDDEFKVHKSNLVNQLDDVNKSRLENEFAKISYARLILKPSALAKSHRPTNSIFKKDTAPVIGGGDLGELYVEIRPGSIDKLQKKVREAEEATKWKQIKNTDKLIPNPTILRSEVGAIEEIIPYSKNDKRKFSVSKGLEWIKNPLTGGAYIIELFENPPLKQNWDNLDPDKYVLFKSFLDGLTNISPGIVMARLSANNGTISIYCVRLEDSDAAPSINFASGQSSSKRQSSLKQISVLPSRHNKLIDFLERHPLVKRIMLPPIITKSEIANGSKKVSSARTARLPKIDPKRSYPKVGIIDGGISDVYHEWIEDSWGLLSVNDRDTNHGSFIAGLLVASKSLNGPNICREDDGCRIIDLDILPKTASFQSYFPKPFEFFSELEMAVKELKARTGVRVFNFSLNIEEHDSNAGYSPYAQILDSIAEENDVIFTISVGNAKRNNFRKEWPEDPVAALTILANSRNDGIQRPSESSRNLSVSSLNPPGLKGIVPYAPSCFSTRGPGVRVGIKPDLAHVGGSGTKLAKSGHGLFSIDETGSIVDGCGTSYAAPHVAKTLASLDNIIEGDVSRESLIAMAIHNASLPEILNDKRLRDVAKYLVGFGMPACSTEIIEGQDHSITLVFANRVYPGRKMSFGFSWPPSLVVDGKCVGQARLTLISTPPFDYRFGSEFVRINVEGYLRQEQKDGKMLGRLDPIYLPNSAEANLFEKDQIEHAFKWSPIKVFEKKFKRGVGPSTHWKLEVEYLERDGVKLPFEGVPFTAILTISDLDKKAPVFNEMRQLLQSTGVKIVDIRTAARVIPRV